jgi:uncharacterized tellurite resistance protein B-like protein
MAFRTAFMVGYQVSMATLSNEQRRTFMALLCRVAWADGVVQESERDAVRDIAGRLAGDAVSEAELTAWLDDGPPDTDLASLPEGLGQYFYYEAFKLAEADGHLAEEEVELLEAIVSRVFSGQPKGTPLARIAIARKKGD